MHYLSIVWDAGKEGIDLGFYIIRYYSLMFVVAFTLGWFIMKRFYKNEGVSEEKLDPLFIYVVLATIIGARLGHYIFYEPEVFLKDPLSVFLPFQFSPKFRFTGFQGLASHGATIGILTTLYIYSKRVTKTPFFWVVDRVVIPTAIGGMFVRFGNFFNSEIIGKPTGTHFGVIFKKLGEDLPRHPTQIYEGLGYLLVFFILWYIYWKTDKRKQLGYIFGVFMVLLWLVRFIVEFWKEAQVDDRAEWALNTGQWLSIPLILVGLYFMFRKPKIYEAPSDK